MVDLLIVMLIWLWVDLNGGLNDLQTDSSITKYVDDKVHYEKIDYIPKNMVELKWDYLLDFKWNSQVRQITLKNLQLLSIDFYHTFWRKLKIVSAYRNYKYQKRIKDRGCSDLFCAKAWYSEHQSGLAVDFWEASTLTNYQNNRRLKKYFEWIKKYWPKHWFTNTYQKWREIDGYAIEPWHWRYVWKSLAQYLSRNNITFAEYYYYKSKK
jgi:LAS superfamily LD-carboxypeptidase LdcB